ncbi:MAG: hypothetical protein ED557_12015 [Balneola sp.]|nr:MAG: hypothetical protein ED557_12015 [Balneola sp.]
MNTLSKTLSIITLFVAVSAHSVQAQGTGESSVDYSDNLNVAFPSPTASSFLKAEDIPIDMYNGTSTVTIPLYTFSNGKTGIPLNLSYSSSGFRVQERASRIGLGWNLQIGGAITRVMVGLPDDNTEGTGYMANSTHLKNNTIDTSPSNHPNLTLAEKELMDDMVDGEYDTQPDKFILSTPTVSGEFFYVDSNEGFVFKSRQKEVKIEYHTSAGNSNDIDSWTITDASGIKYTFDMTEIANNVASSMSNPSSGFYNSAWYLTKIEHPQTDNDLIIEYDTTKYSSDETSYNESIIIYTSSGFCSTLDNNVNTTTSYTYRETPLPKKLKYANDPNSYVEFIWATRQDITSERRLSEIKVVRNSNLLKKFALTHSYFTNGSTHKRLKLDEVQEYDVNETNTLPPYTFTYQHGAIPDYGSKSMDYWGYYNGATQNTTYIPTTSYNGSVIFNGAYREPDAVYSKTGLLTKVDYPSGGSASIQYEANSYSYVANTLIDTTKTAGGVRVSSVTWFDGISTDNNVVKTYEYTMTGGSGYSSGNLNQEPTYLESGNYHIFYDSSIPINVNCDYVQVKSSAAYQMTNHTWNHLGYQAVTEFNASTNEFGETIYHFEKQPFLDKGNMIKTESLDDTNAKMAQSENDYFYQTQSTWVQGATPNRVINVHGCGGCLNPQRDTIYTFGGYSIFEQLSYLDVSKEQIYNGTANAITKITDYDYNTTSMLLTSKTDSVAGESTSRLTTYAYYSDGSKNIFDYPSSVSVKEGGTTLSSISYTWGTFNGNVQVDEQKVWNSGASHMVYDALSYDSQGNVLQATNALGDTTHFYYGSATNPYSQDGLYGVNGVYLTGIRKVMDSSGCTGNDLCSEAEYDSLGMITKVIAQDEKEQTFTYDDFNRLTGVYNDAGQQVSAHSYTYTGTNFSPTNPNWVETTGYTGSDSRVSRQYVDGMGRSVQTVSAAGSEVIIAAESFNDRGLPWKSYKPFSRSGTGMSFETVTDSAAKAKHANQDAFTITEYEDSPMKRPVKAIPLGGETTYGSVTTSHSIEAISGTWYSVTTTTDQVGNITKTYTDGWGRTKRTVSDSSGINAITDFVYNSLDQLTEVRPPNYHHPPSGTVAGDWVISYSYDNVGNLTSKTSNDFGTVNYAYDKAYRLRFSQDANQAADGEVAYTRYDELGRVVQTGIADYSGSFSALDPDNTYSFESTEDYQKGAFAYDTKPSTSSYPWSEFPTEITNFSMNATRAQGQLVADMYRFMPEPLEANVDTSGLGISGAETYRAIDTLTVSNTDALSGSDVLFEAGRMVLIQADFTAFDGSEVVIGIDESLAGTDSVGVNAQTGANQWQLQLYSYDSEGRLAEKQILTGSRRDWDATISYEYNRLGELTRREIEIGEDVIYHHYDYDELGRLASVTLTADGVADTEMAEITYSYEADGNIEEKQYKGGTTFDYQYDIQSRLTQINDPEVSSHAFSAAYTYFDNGNINEAEFYNPLTSLGSDHYRYKYTHTYDKLNRLTSAIYSNYASSSWASTDAFKVYSLEYDDQGNITKLGRYDETSTQVDLLLYSYGGNNRLSSVMDLMSTTSETWDAEDATYGYDSNGNMTSQTGKFDNLIYNEFNLPIQIETNTGSTLKANYNGEGNRVFKEFSAGTWTYYIRDGGETLATIDQDGDLNLNLIGMGTEGQLLGGVLDPVIDLTNTVSSESEPNGSQASADGPIGLSVYASISGSDSDWYYFEVLRSGTVTITKARTTAEYESTEYDLDWEVVKNSSTVATGTGSGSFSVTPGTYYIKINYLQGVADYYDLELSAQSSAEYATRYFLKDHLGSTRAIVDEIGTHLDSYDYYPFGLEMPGRSSNSANPNDNYKYIGEELDDEAGLDLMHLNARTMDPVLGGRFLQIDPYAREFPNLSPYSYSYNNPILYSDPTGEYPDCSTKQECLDTYVPGTIIDNTMGLFEIAEDGSIITHELYDYEVTTTVYYARPNHYGTVRASGPALLGTACADTCVPGPADVVATGVFLGLVADATYNAITFDAQETFSITIHSYQPPPQVLPGFPGARDVGRRAGRKRWIDTNGDILEWDSRHGEVEVYDKTGKKHKGAYDPNTGEQKKPPKKGRTTKKQ